MNYDQTLKELFATPRKIKLDLANIEFALDRLHHPERNYCAVHVAGTNGKGSVSVKIAKGLELSGFRTGLFTSPHISTFRERIQVNGKMISERKVVDLYAVIHSLSIPLTFFEIATLMSLLYFSEERVNWAVFETGIGGRLDATNCLLPKLSVITSIALDHTEILGETLEQIAKEKGGIIKLGIPVVIGPRVPFTIIEEIALSKQSALKVAPQSGTTFEDENNAISKTAMQLLNIPSPFIAKALDSRPPCRMEEIRSPNYLFPVILDVAHNPDGFEALFRYVEKLPVIVGLSESKDLRGCLEILCKKASHLYLVQAKSVRAASREELVKILDELAYKDYTCCDSVKEALSLVSSKVIICGTFYIMAEARKALGLSYPEDCN